MFNLVKKIPSLMWSLIAFALLAVVFNAWVYNQQRQAVKARDAQIEQATKVQVKKDEQIVIESYQPSAAIESHVDGMLDAESAKARGRDRLLSPETSAGTTERSEASPDLGTSNKLSDQEIDFIKSNAGLLQ